MREVAEWYARQPDIALIFEGKVVRQDVRSGSPGGPPTAMSMTLSGKHRVVEFDVMRVFRGANQARVSIVTGLGTGDCGYDFWPGENYLVYASSGPRGIWFTSICSGTTAIQDAGIAIRYLSGEKPTAEDLLSPQEYEKQFYEDVVPKRTGSVCGQVLKPDGSALKGANVELWEPRSDGLPPRGGSDPNTSSDTGHFCIANVAPGKYFLTAESSDYDHWTRYMGFYPGVRAEAGAVRLSIEAGVRLPDVKFATLHEPLYRIRIRVVASDKTPLSYKNGCGVAVNSVEDDPLSYHISNMLKEDGTYTFGYIPPGKYQVTTYFQPILVGGGFKLSSEASKWKADRKEVIVVVRGDTEVTVQLEPAHAN
ncbi:MAG TPA: carboxypeptidase-like regulatory domain-containing protein [Candidatus Limnocylindrales bacterium]|nr:carboxypeptidase-like regulatory domain-containing protein [Candidatus Limnocylindrales bacterium]